MATDILKVKGSFKKSVSGQFFNINTKQYCTRCARLYKAKYLVQRVSDCTIFLIPIVCHSVFYILPGFKKLLYNAVLVSCKVSCTDSLRLYQYSEPCPLVL